MRRHFYSIVLGLLFAVVGASASPEKLSPQQQQIAQFEVKVISIENTDCEGAIEFLRFKATQALRSVVPASDKKRVMIFELRFDPDYENFGSKVMNKINYEARGVSLDEAMKKCLEQVGLEYRFVADDRIAIIDADSENEEAEQGEDTDAE